MTREASDKYTDKDAHVIKKEAGRRPASQMTREAQVGKSSSK